MPLSTQTRLTRRSFVRAHRYTPVRYFVEPGMEGYLTLFRQLGDDSAEVRTFRAPQWEKAILPPSLDNLVELSPLQATALDECWDLVRGGRGSGNFGHLGRPGERGGSESQGGGIVRAANRILKSVAEDEPVVTKLLVDAADRHGGTMVHLQHRLKTPESLIRKITNDAIEGGITPAEAASNVTDALRYTMLFDHEGYVDNVKTVQDALSAKGFTRYDDKFKNYLSGTDYRGYNCVFTDGGNTKFELQFHTPESFKAKDKSHEIYSKIRVMPRGPERESLTEEMQAIWRAVPPPANWTSLPGKVMH